MGFNFRVLSIPITIGPSIVLGLLVLGGISGLSGEFLAEWVVFGVVALLLHELGHALAFRRYGVGSSIRFWLLGGFTMPGDIEAASQLSDRQMLAVTISGPLVGLVVGGVTLAVLPALHDSSRSISEPVFLWTYVNLGWAIFNLMPISSLDGGRALTHLAGAVFGRPGRAVGLATCVVASVLIAVVAVDLKLYSIAFIAVAFGLLNPSAYGMLLDEAWPNRAASQKKKLTPGRDFWTAEDERSAHDTETREPLFRDDPPRRH